jgi:hypothetical protein
MPVKEFAPESDRVRALRHLRELIAALDRRVPDIARSGEIAIARDAATLRAEALERIAELEAAIGERSNDQAGDAHASVQNGTD